MNEQVYLIDTKGYSTYIHRTKINILPEDGCLRPMRMEIRC